MLGLTQDEIEHYFQDDIIGFAGQKQIPTQELIDKIRFWYNGFCFAANGQNVYNPFSTLLFFKQQRFASFWFETGTPTFLVKLIRQGNFDVRRIENLALDEPAFSTYDIDHLEVEPLLFQTGYLTIKDYDENSGLYRLYYPNYEVENAFLKSLLYSYSELSPAETANRLMTRNAPRFTRSYVSGSSATAAR
jgi:hypothetical protein